MPPTNTKRDLISKYPGGNVAPGSPDISTIGPDPLPPNRTFKISAFGAALTIAGTVDLEYRPTAVAPWRILRRVVGPGNANYDSFPVIEGDGTNAIRVVRTNTSGGPEKMPTWVEGFKR